MKQIQFVYKSCVQNSFFFTSSCLLIFIRILYVYNLIILYLYILYSVFFYCFIMYKCFYIYMHMAVYILCGFIILTVFLICKIFFLLLNAFFQDKKKLIFHVIVSQVIERKLFLNKLCSTILLFFLMKLFYRYFF